MATFQILNQSNIPPVQLGDQIAVDIEKDKTLYIDGYLMIQLDSILYNLPYDWDIVILISGDRMVRVGKSKLATDICAYMSYRLRQLKLSDEVYGLDNIFFDSKAMVDSAIKKPKYSINHYDEGREGLAAVRAMTSVQKDLVDFFNECGQLNQIFVIVLPDYFSLNEDIAVGRSEYLINVFRKDIKKEIDMYKEGNKITVVKWKRGYFEFFNRYRKQVLYDKYRTTRKKNYRGIKYNFWGSFKPGWIIDYDKYIIKKREALARHKEAQESRRTIKGDLIRDKIIIKLHKEGKSNREISKILADEWELVYGYSSVGDVIRRHRNNEKNL